MVLLESWIMDGFIRKKFRIVWERRKINLGWFYTFMRLAPAACSKPHPLTGAKMKGIVWGSVAPIAVFLFLWSCVSCVLCEWYIRTVGNSYVWHYLLFELWMVLVGSWIMDGFRRELNWLNTYGLYWIKSNHEIISDRLYNYTVFYSVLVDF